MNVRWYAVGAASQAILAATFVARYLDGGTSVWPTGVGFGVATLGTASFAVLYHRRRRGESS